MNNLEPGHELGTFEIIKRSVQIAGHRTSISLESPFWTALKTIACSRDISVQMLVAEIDASRGKQNLSSALRVYVLQDCLMRKTADNQCARSENGH